MKRAVVLLLVMLLSLGAVNWASPSAQGAPSLQTDELTLRVVDCTTGTLPNVVGDAGTQMCISALASGTTSLQGLQFNLLFDPEVLRLVGLAQGQIPQGWLFAPNTTQTGVVSIAFAGSGAAGVDAFVTAQLTFQLIGSEGQCSDLIFSDALAGDSSIPPQSIPIVPVNGSICIGGAPPDALTKDEEDKEGVDQPAAIQEERFTVVETATSTVTPQNGGVLGIEFLDAVKTSVEVPPGAVDRDTLIEVAVGLSGDPKLPPLPPGSFTQVFGFSPHGLRFLANVTIVISYSDSEVSDLDERTMSPLLLVGNEWVRVQSCETVEPLNPDPCLVERDMVNNSLFIDVTHFSIYGVEGRFLRPPLVAIATGLAPLQDNLVRVWHFDNTTKEWAFYDPRPIFAQSNTEEELVPGDAYFIKVNDDQIAVLNGKEHHLFAGWNLIGW